MSKYTRWAPLLVCAMPDELRDAFFSGDPDEDLDPGWDLFETAYPSQATILFESLLPMLEGVKKELQYEKKYNRLLDEGDDLGAARLKVCHKAGKLDW